MLYHCFEAMALIHQPGEPDVGVIVSSILQLVHPVWDMGTGKKLVEDSFCIPGDLGYLLLSIAVVGRNSDGGLLQTDGSSAFGR